MTSKSELTCPTCGSQVFERVMDSKVVDRAEYVDGKLVIIEKSFEVRESYIRCAKCLQSEWSAPTLEAAIEELFL